MDDPLAISQRTNAPKTLIIMPAWNEEEVIASTLAELKSHHLRYDIAVVDDGSLDSTVELARQAGAIVIPLPFNLGVGGAMRCGYEYARRHGYDRAIQVDADGQHDPQDIDLVLAGLDQADISIGARFAQKGAYTVHGPRRWAMVVLAWVLSRLSHVRLTDVTSGFRAANRTAIEQYCRYYPVEYLGDTIDSLVMAVRSGLTVTQVPVEMRARQGGAPSNNPFKAMVYLVRSLFSLAIALTQRATSVRRSS
ncbi:MAG: glycosyltransferase family 2 protein [Propionibacteriaceae bacterium]|jgi:glycosyltransferase involved in cell wall biosynthesis|nr:glycosyltransferase family 2 protein [Propionibacteriaceae bacterium]